jgi:HSP20 family protein
MARSSHWRREPFSPINILQHELGRVLEEYIRSGRYPDSEGAPTDLVPSAWTPAVDVYETAEEVVVLAEIPGVDPASVDLAVTGNVLTLRGGKETSDMPDAVIQLKERRFGPFHRELTLSNEVDLDKAQADAKQGVLKIRIPKRMAAKPRTIPIRPS